MTTSFFCFLIFLKVDVRILPPYTRNVIQKTQNANVYIIGSTISISNAVEQEIRKLNVKFVDRISGSTPYEVAVNFAKYKSPVGNFGLSL